MSFFEYMMRRAAPVLFWTSVLMFIGGVAISFLGDRQIVGESILNADSFVRGIFTGLSGAALPFLGAALIWTLQTKRSGQ
jgi:hypothetical protein